MVNGNFVIGREEDDLAAGPAGTLGSYRALDGSAGARLHLDFDGPHAMLVVGKRGYGKSYTLGVVAEELARTPEVAPVAIDPMGVFDGLTQLTDDDADAIPATVVSSPSVTPDSLDPRSWCSLLGLSPESGAGGLVWQAAQRESSLDAMSEHVAETNADQANKRAATNHLELARGWGVFDTDGLDASALTTGDATILDVSGLGDAPMNAVVRGVAESLYRARVHEEVTRLPWLLLDEAHTFFRGVAREALERLLTRGRAPGVSLVAATQRPSAIPEVGISQSDILVSHRLTSHDDLAALERAQPTYMNSSLDERMPTEPGDVIIVDDSTETVHAASIRERLTHHGGDSPSTSDITSAAGVDTGADDSPEQTSPPSE
jgi:hypothetical protein